jgi:hypothetical protein
MNFVLFWLFLCPESDKIIQTCYDNKR